MFNPFFVDNFGKKHIFPDDRALKQALTRAWRRGEDVFHFQYSAMDPANFDITLAKIKKV